MKPQYPFIWSPQQSINSIGFLASNRHGPPRSDGVNRWFLFRRALTLPAAPQAAITHVTVDGRYRLYVNGRFVGRGPIRSSPLFQRYDTYDLAPFLHAGENVLAVEAHTYGVDTAWYETVKGMWHETFGDGALWVEGEAQCAGAAIAFGSDSEWRCTQSKAWDGESERMNAGLGFIEELDANKLPRGWQEAGFDGTGWDRAQALVAGGGGPEGFFSGLETRPFPILIARSIPELVERFVAPERLVRMDWLTPRPDLPVHRRGYEEMATPADAEITATIWSPTALPREPALVRSTPSHDAALLFDFGTLITGYPTFEIEARGGETIEIAVSERLPDEWSAAGPAPNARIKRVPMLGRDAHICRYVARPGRQVFERFEWSAIRWMQVTVRNAPDGVRFHRLGAILTHYPVEELGRFSCSDPFLEKLWAVGAYTLKQCMHDGWEDCPSREQRQWLGDATVENLVGHAAFGPSIAPLNALFLRQAAESQRPDGLTQMFAPGDHYTNGLLIPDWTLQWILNAGDHWLYTGDRQTIEAVFPAIQKALAWFVLHKGPSGLIADLPYWHFIDWAGVGRTGEACTLNALYAGCLQTAAMLADVVGYTSGGDQYRAEAAHVQRALNARHWDEVRGVYVDCVDPRTGRQGRRVSQHANAAMALWGAAPPERISRALDAIVDTRRLVFTSAPPIVNHTASFDEEVNIVLANTFFAHYVYCALAAAGRLSEALAMMRVRLGPMIDRGSPTLWESLEPSSSLCHGFSASPTYQMSAHLLGVRPAQPGFSQAVIQPDLCALDHAEGEISTPHGPICVRLDRTPSGFTAHCTPPPGVQLLPQASPGYRLTQNARLATGAIKLHYARVAKI